MYGIMRSGFRSFKSVGTTIECVFSSQCPAKYIGLYDAPDLIPYALHHYLVSDKFYIYLKDWFHLYERENRTAYRKEIT